MTVIVATLGFPGATAPSAGAQAAPPVGVFVGPGLGGIFNLFCSGVLNGFNPLTGRPINVSGADPVTKSVVRTDNPNGSSTFAVTVIGPVDAQFSVADGYDCVWIDTNGNGSYDGGSETLRPYLASELTITGTGATRQIEFQVTVPGAVGKQVCDRAAGVNYTTLLSSAGSSSGIESGSWLYFYSQTKCSPAGAPDPVVPEAPLVPVFAAAGGLAVGVVLLVRGRMGRAAER